MVGQLATIDLQTRLLILIHQVDHRLAAVAGFGMHMFKQQQRGGAPALEHLAPFGLAIQQRSRQQLTDKRRQGRDMGPDQRQGVVAVLPQ